MIFAGICLVFLKCFFTRPFNYSLCGASIRSTTDSVVLQNPRPDPARPGQSRPGQARPGQARPGLMPHSNHRAILVSRPHLGHAGNGRLYYVSIVSVRAVAQLRLVYVMIAVRTADSNIVRTESENINLLLDVAVFRRSYADAPLLFVFPRHLKMSPTTC